MIEIDNGNGYDSFKHWQGPNPFEDEDSSYSGFDTFRDWWGYLDYLRWETPNVVKDGVDASFECLRAGVEVQRLLFNPIYKERDFPRGDGSFVGLFSGFLGNKYYYTGPIKNLRELNWDARVYPDGNLSHIKPTEKMIKPFIAFSKEMAERSGRKIHWIGHSKGGHVILAAAITRTEELAESVDQIIIVDAPIPDRINYQTGVAYLVFQTIYRGDDFRLTRLADDKEGLARIEEKFRYTNIKVSNGRIIKGLHVGSKENTFEVDCSHPGAVHANLRFIHTRLARLISESQKVQGELRQFSVKSAA